MELHGKSCTDDDGGQDTNSCTALALGQLSLQRREELVYKLLESLPREHVARVHRRTAFCIQVDIVGSLPSELALHIFSYLSSHSLLRCALVNKRWHALANDSTLWKALCAQRGWKWHSSRVPRTVVPSFMDTNGDEGFQDEGMGEDEEPESDHVHGNLGTGHHLKVNVDNRDDTQSHPVIGLPSTPRLRESHCAGADRRRRPSPSPNRKAQPHLLSSRRCLVPSDLQLPETDYKLLYQTRLLLKNRVLRGSFRFSTLQKGETPNGHTSIIYCMQLYTYAEDNQQALFTGSKDKTIREWNLTAGSVERVFKGVHTGSVLSLCAHGNYLASGGSDFRVCVWDLRDGTLVKSIVDHSDSVLCVRFDSRRLVSCSKDRTIRMYRFTNSCGPSKLEVGPGKILGTHRAAVNAVALSDSLVMSASGDKSLKLWDTESGTLLRTFEAHHARGIASIDFAPPLVMSGSSDKHIRVFDIEKLRGWSTAPEFHNLLPNDSIGRGVGVDKEDYAVCKFCEGALLQGAQRRCSGLQSRHASVSANGSHRDLVRSVSIGSDFVLSGSYDQTLKIWNRETGSLVADLSGGHEGRIFCVGFDCTKIVSCGEDQKICVWDFSYDLDTSFIQRR